MPTDPTRPPKPPAVSFDVAPVRRKPGGFAPGSVLGGNFRLEFQLGRGGMGEAWKAYDLTADRFVVLKFVPKEIQHVQEAMEGVRDSFRKVHELQHQHVCPVYGLFTDPQHGYYLVMKYIDGIPLDEYKRKQAEKRGRMPSADAIQILWAIAKGLDYAHGMKVIHRDIKPQNIMIGKKEGVQIIDFGLAEEIRTSMTRFSEVEMSTAGTRPYMAPEQWRGRLQDARTDQYALAVTAYELLAGHPPFMGSDA
ncbi:MAG: serine/threonine protein kinase, partial [Planctomycetaceae bacterium]|nr:serine/threonine protein kinase [Planctomycetaceae bacterium]